MAVAEYREAIGDREHLVQAVGDEDRRDALVAEPPDEREERLHLVVGERARRLVEDEDARVDRQSARDLDHLLLVGPQPPDEVVRVDVELEAGERLPRPAPRRVPVDERPAADHPVTEENVLGDREVGRERRLLRHCRDALPERVGRVAERRLASSEGDRRRVGLDLPREDLQHRRLARAVLADERVDLARVDRRAARHAARGRRRTACGRPRM